MATRYSDLADYLKKTGTTQEDFAATVDTTQSRISLIASGEVIPRAELAQRIALKAHIPLDSFIKRHLLWRQTHQRELAS